MKTKHQIKKRLEFWESWLEADIEHKDWKSVVGDDVAIKVLKWVLEDNN